MGVFDDLPALIGEVITDLHASEGLGFTVTYTSVTPGVYDTSTGRTAAPSTSVQSGVVAFEDTFSVKEFAAGLVEGNDKAIGIPATLLTASPKPADVIAIGGVDYSVLRIRDTTPSTVALHQLHCRA